MRLFIAINFSEEFKDGLAELSADLSKCAIFSRMTQKQNYHLTLVFLGEQERTEDIKAAMDAVHTAPFTIAAHHVGKFPSRDSAVFWIGLKHNPALLALQSDLCQELRQRGFTFDKRNFRPHLTLIREALMPPDFDISAYSCPMEGREEKISRISLMESKRINGKLVYEELYSKDL